MGDKEGDEERQGWGVGLGKVESFHPSKMDVLMHLLCVKSSTTCHINISAFTDAATGDDIEGKIWH